MKCCLPNTLGPYRDQGNILVSVSPSLYKHGYIPILYSFSFKTGQKCYLNSCRFYAIFLCIIERSDFESKLLVNNAMRFKQQFYTGTEFYYLFLLCNYMHLKFHLTIL